jgi:integrase
MKIKVLNLSFGSMKPAMIDEDRWLTHIRHRITNCKGLHDQPLSRDTLLVEQQTLSAVLRYAYRKKLITGIPELRLPPEAPEPRVRPFFTATERQMLIHKLEQRVADAPNRIIRYARQLLLHYIAILFMTGMRTNDALLLRWKDIVHEVTPGGLRIAKLYLRGKGKPRISLALPDAVKWINKWSEISKYKDDNDLVFTRGRKLPWNGRRGLRAVLEEMKMVNDNFDRPRTPYSLRHTFAMLLLRHPECRVDILAKIMGTSVKMIEKHYGNHASFDNDAALLHRIHEPDPLIDPQVMARLRAEADELFDRQEEVLAGIALAADTDDDEEQEEILRPSVPAVTPKWRLRVGRRSERRPPALPMIIDTAPAAGSPIEIIPPHADPETLLRLAERHFAAIQTIMDALAATENPDLSGVQCLMALRQRGLELAKR